MTVTKKQQCVLKNIKNGFIYVSLIGVLGSFLLFIPSLLKVGVGIWPQSELQSIYLHVCGLLAAIGLGGLCMTTTIGRRALSTPQVLLPLCIGALTLLWMPFHDMPVRSLLGTPRIGEGAAYWLDIGSLTAAALILWRLPLCRKAMVYVAVISILVCAGLTFSHQIMDHYIAPYFFTDFLALMIVAVAPYVYMKGAARWPHWLYSAVFYAVLATVILATENKAMALFALAVMPCVFVVGHVPWLKPILKQRLSLLGVAAIPVGILALYYAFLQISGSHGYYEFMHTGLMNTLISRAFLMDVTLHNMGNNPLSPVTGFGWGTYVDFLAAYQPSQWLDFTTFSSQWDGFSTDHFHSHNMFLETFSAIGVIGAAALFLYGLSFAMNTKAGWQTMGWITAAAFMVSASMWFMFPLQAAYLVFAVASISRIKPVQIGALRLKLPRAVVSGFLVICVLAQGYAVYAASVPAFGYNTYDPKPYHPAENAPCPEHYKDARAGGMHLSRMLLDRLRYTVDLADQIANPDNVPEGEEAPAPEEVKKHVLQLNALFCQAGEYINRQGENVTDRLVVAHLTTRAEALLALAEYMDDPTLMYYYAGWREDLMAWLATRPARFDMASPYLLYHVMRGQEAVSMPVVMQLHQQNAQNPLALWFRGLYLLNNPQTLTQGLHMMRAALDRGIQRFVVVEDDVKAMLLSLPETL